MNKDYSKPTFIDVQRETNKKHPQVLGSMQAILEEEAFAVLATNAQNESYSSLISYATNNKLTLLAFSTPVHTKKYQMIERDENVSLLIDNRATIEKDINDIVAITIIGKAKILTDREERKRWSKILIDKHQYLDDFVCADTSAIILVSIEKIYYVSRFQEVVEWRPNNTN